MRYTANPIFPISPAFLSSFFLFSFSHLQNQLFLTRLLVHLLPQATKSTSPLFFGTIMLLHPIRVVMPWTHKRNAMYLDLVLRIFEIDTFQFLPPITVPPVYPPISYLRYTQFSHSDLSSTVTYHLKFTSSFCFLKPHLEGTSSPSTYLRQTLIKTE